jgi:hypothetical protein
VQGGGCTPKFNLTHALELLPEEVPVKSPEQVEVVLLPEIALSVLRVGAVPEAV